MDAPSVTFGIHVDLESKTQLLGVARRAEAQGFDMLTVADHPGTSPSPFPTLAAVAAVTETIRLGPYVANAGLRRPLDLAVDVVTLDVLSDGRAFLGLGAGHTPAEWSSQGLSRPNASDRVTRLIETADAVGLLLAGEVVSVAGETVTLVEATLETPMPVQDRLPLLVGGNNRRLLSYAGANADVVAFTGFGRTLPDGHTHRVRWSSGDLAESFGLVAEAAHGRNPEPVRQALVQVVIITDDRRAAAATVADRIGTSVDDLLEVPFILVGTHEQMIESIERHQERWGISSYIIRAAAADAVAPLVEHFAAS